MKKILFATIVPFWNRETGAQQRIFSLVKVLERNGHQVRVFFPGHAEHHDRQLAQQLKLDVAFHSSDESPPTNRSIAERLKWQFDAVVHALRNHKTNVRRQPPLTLSDFRWPWAEDKFQQIVKDFVPHAILCEYITMAYLVEALRPEVRAKIHCLVDTHDLLSRRQEQFAQNNRPHWIAVSPQEEASALNVFDTLIAIQPCEAEAIKAITNDKTVIVVGHQPHVAADGIPTTLLVEPTKTTLGYLGSDNDSNTDAINQFLKVVWNRLKDKPNLSLIIAGRVSERVSEHLRFDNVNLLGHVSNLKDFYDSIDAAINPVSYGTGLKIKSVEAIAYRKPLLCTADGWIGEPIDGVTVVKSLEKMENVINLWLKDPTSFQAAKSAAIASSKSQSEQAYTPLLDLLTRI